MRRKAAAAGLLALSFACGRGSQEVRESASAATAGGGPARMVADLRIASQPLGSSPAGYVVSGSFAYFTADDGSSGRELWRTDGTPGGTTLVADIFPGASPSSPSSIVPFGDGVLFAASDGARGRELWRSDASGATALVRDIWPGSRGSNPRSLTVVGAQVFFAAETAAGVGLWRTDGTRDGTVPIAAAAGTSPSELAALGTTLFFAGDGGAGVGVELWKSDGTEGGTFLVDDILLGGSSSPHGLTAWNGKLYFAATTSAGVRLHAIGPADAAAQTVGTDATIVDPSLFTPFVGAPGSVLYYRARKGPAAPWNLFSTTGTGQQQQTGGATGRPDLDVREMAVAGGKLFVSGVTAADGHELFSWNGATPQLQLADLVPGSGSSQPAGLTELGGKLLFSALRSGVRSLFVSDPALGSTGPVLSSMGTVGEIAAFAGQALVTADDGARGPEPWKSDGTAAGTTIVRNVRPDVPGSSPAQLVTWDGRLYFSADGDDGALIPIGRELYSSDGTAGGTRLEWDVFLGSADADVGSLADAGAASAGCDLGQQWTCSGGLLFAAFTEPYGRELWRWGGAQITPVPVLDVNAVPNPLTGGTRSSAPSELTRVGAITYFTADDGAGGRELWRTDGSRAGTALVADLRPGGSSFPTGLTGAGGLLYFAATTNGVDLVPFRSDGSAAGTFALPMDPFWIDPILHPSA
ncbi:MAG TPA: ELWxxDGT repeat protein, partial [Anaeromyxobacter sp.]